MRLTKEQLWQLRSIVRGVFGQNTPVRLFGSRVDDRRRGGDFDVFVETELTDAREVVKRKLDCLARLHASPEFEGEKIDLLIASRVEGSALPIHDIARSRGIPL